VIEQGDGDAKRGIPAKLRGWLRVPASIGGALVLAGSAAVLVGAANMPLPVQHQLRTVAVPGGPTISDEVGSCVTFNGLEDAIIENLTLGPCADKGIELRDSKRVIIRNVTVKGTRGSGIYVFNSDDVEVSGNTISDASNGIYAERSTGVRVSCNSLENMRGPVPTGQFVQFNRVEGPRNQIQCNSGRNIPGPGLVPEDAINLYKSSGTAQSPILVKWNLVVGGGPSPSGGGIMLGDSGGAFQIAEGNILVDPGQYGVGISSGNNIQVLDNQIFARRQPFTNAGIYVWNQYPPACYSHKVSGNRVRWTNKSGHVNGWWNGRNCGAIEGVATNDFAADLTAGIAETKAPAECGCTGAGRN